MVARSVGLDVEQVRLAGVAPADADRVGTGARDGAGRKAPLDVPGSNRGRPGHPVSSAFTLNPVLDLSGDGKLDLSSGGSTVVDL